MTAQLRRRPQTGSGRGEIRRRIRTGSCPRGIAAERLTDAGGLSAGVGGHGLEHGEEGVTADGPGLRGVGALEVNVAGG